MSASLPTSSSPAEKIKAFLNSEAFAVAGASDDLRKYGAKAFAAYLQKGLDAYPVNPNRDTVLGRPCHSTLAELPPAVDAVSIVTQPDVTEDIVEQAVSRGISHLWMQPGAESVDAIRRAEEAGISVIHGGPCILVVLGYREV